MDISSSSEPGGAIDEMTGAVTGEEPEDDSWEGTCPFRRSRRRRSDLSFFRRLLLSDLDLWSQDLTVVSSRRRPGNLSDAQRVSLRTEGSGCFAANFRIAIRAFIDSRSDPCEGPGEETDPSFGGGPGSASISAVATERSCLLARRIHFAILERSIAIRGNLFLNQRLISDTVFSGCFRMCFSVADLTLCRRRRLYTRRSISLC